MKKLFLFCILFPTFVFGNPLLKELMSVNKQWTKNADGILYVKGLEALPNDDIIISHLILVEKILRARPVNHLTRSQKENRISYLNILKSYWKIGIVPANDYAPGTFPIFIDRKGVHCAVGYLLQQGGFEYIARKINNQQKFAYIQQIKVPELVHWQQESGFTQDELAWIQPGYVYQGTATELGKGLKGEVNDIKNCMGKYSLIAAGKFKIDEDTNFVILAGFNGQKWNSIITASGIINKIEVNGNIITSYGGDISFGDFNRMEILETDIGNTLPVHKLRGELNGEILDFETYNGKKYVCGKFTGGLAVWDGINWVAISSPEINNPTSIRVYKGKLFITGIKNPNSSYGLVSFDGQEFEVKNYLVKQPNYLQVFNNKLFIGLKTDGKYYTDTLLFTYDGSKVQRFDSIKYLDGKAVKNIIVRDNKMLLTGELSQQTGWGIYYYGHGLALYDTKFPNKINPVIWVDGSINAGILNGKEEITIAGNFTRFFRYNSVGGQYTMPLLGCGIAYENRIPSSTEKLLKTNL